MNQLLERYAPALLGVTVFLFFVCIGSINLMIIPLIGRFPLNNLMSFIFSLIAGLIIGAFSYLVAKKSLRTV